MGNVDFTLSLSGSNVVVHFCDSNSAGRDPKNCRIL